MVKHAAKDGNACRAGERNIRFPSPVRKSVATVYLVDDDAALLFALSCRLREADFAVKTFLSAAEFLEGWSGEIEVCAVIDVQMPGENGLALQQRLAELGAPIPVVFLSGHGDVSTSVSAMKRGAVDFLTKPVRGDELIQAIECGLARGAAERESRSQKIKWQRRYATLTPSERRVYFLVVQGLPNKKIAEEFGASERTVKAHRAEVMRKMEVNSPAELGRTVAWLGELFETEQGRAPLRT